VSYTRALSATFDCQACGRCCFGQRDYVQVFAHDAARLGPEQLAKVVAPARGELPASPGRAAEPRRFMRMVEGRCAALKIADGSRFTCGVYQDRPTLCRALEPGSRACLEARVAGGLPVPSEVQPVA
jgi:Fe-S-cluster containining protein